MRIAIAAVVGVVLAALASVFVVQVSNASQSDPVIKPLYNYGSR
ncbi:hypothetical protein [Actinomadura rudentiformis]|nr:hypothetical protein [Actinomadura rudentiformis]